MCLAERLQLAAWVSVILSQLLPQFLIFGVLYPTPRPTLLYTTSQILYDSGGFGGCALTSGTLLWS